MRHKLFFNFFLFFFLSLLVLGFSKSIFISQTDFVIASLLSPFEKIVFGILGQTTIDERIKKIEDENRTLKKQLVERDVLLKDMQALKDQFQTAYPRSQNLLPARIVGAPRFIPGVTQPEQFIINRGKQDGVKIQQAVVFEDNLLGKIIEVSENLAKIDVVTNASFSSTAKVLPAGRQVSKTGAIGVIKGKGNGEMILDNILLEDVLSVSDIVVTRGDIDLHGDGIPKDLIVGTIISVDKKPSALFQTAKVKSVLDISTLSTVFVVITSE